MGMHSTLLVIHILSVSVLFGGIIAMSYAGSALTGSDLSVRRWFADAQLAASRVLFSVAAVLILITGVWLVLDSDIIEFSDTYVSIGFLVVIAVAILSMAVYAPACKQLIASIDARNPSAEQAASRKVMLVNSINSVLLLVAIVAMVAHW